MKSKIVCADSLKYLKTLPDNSLDSTYKYTKVFSCLFCGKFKKRVKSSQKYCTYDCAVKDRSNLPSRIVGDSRNCVCCNKEFFNRKCENKKYCSTECFYEMHRIMIRCFNCHRWIHGKIALDQKYCSKKCHNSHKKYKTQNNPLKRCGICQEWKDKSNFRLNKARDDGYNPKCKFCAKEDKRKRRIKKKSLKEKFTPQQEKLTREVFSNRCVNCGSVENLCLDHYYPLSKGNPLKPTNACILCRSCNSSKGSKDPVEHFGLIKHTAICIRMLLAKSLGLDLLD